jgi:hypothetical protein
MEDLIVYADIIGTNSAGFALNITLLVMKIRYDKTQQKSTNYDRVGSDKSIDNPEKHSRYKNH